MTLHNRLMRGTQAIGYTPPVFATSIWASTATPAILADTDFGGIECGVKFRSDAIGSITGIRFYKGATNTGTHVGSLWSSTGTLLAQVTFTGETATGWQQMLFTDPVGILANTTYVASYHMAVGHYSVDTFFFTSQGIDRGVLHALQSGVDGLNGVIVYNANPTFPNTSFQDRNYWVDVVFSTDVPPPPPPPPVPTGFIAPVSVGITGTMLMGINSHDDPPPAATKSIAAKFNSVRAAGWQNQTSSRWPSDWFANRPADGSAVLVDLPLYGTPTQPIDRTYDYGAQWTAMVNDLRGVVTYFEVGNEPQNGSGPTDLNGDYYASLTRTATASVKAILPNAKICAPAILSPWGGGIKDWISRFFSFSPQLDVFSFHDYSSWNTPEQKLISGILPTIQQARSYRPGIPVLQSEEGYSTSVSQAPTDPNNFQYADFKSNAQLMYEYPRNIILSRGSGLIGTYYYKIWKPGTADDQRTQMGVYEFDWTNTPFLQGMADALTHCVAANDSSNYNVGNVWYSRLRFLTGTLRERLFIWHFTSTTTQNVTINVPAATALTMQIMGGATTTLASLVAGTQVVSVPITISARILSAAGATFPDFI